MGKNLTSLFSQIGSGIYLLTNICAWCISLFFGFYQLTPVLILTLTMGGKQRIKSERKGSNTTKKMTTNINEKVERMDVDSKEVVTDKDISIIVKLMDVMTMDNEMDIDNHISKKVVTDNDINIIVKLMDVLMVDNEMVIDSNISEEISDLVRMMNVMTVDSKDNSIEMMDWESRAGAKKM